MSSSEVFAHVKDSDVVLLLAFIGGYYDTTGYLKLLGVFTSSITGNLVVACSSVTSNKGVLCRSLVCVAFFLAGVVWIVMLIVWIVGSKKDDSIRNAENLNDGNVILLGTLMGAAMGFHNIAAKESITNCPPTTVMTSTLVNVASNVGAVITDYASFHSTSIPWFIVTFIIFEILVKEYGHNSIIKEKSAENKPEIAKAIELTAKPIEPSNNVKDVEDIYDVSNINDNKTIANV
eukprot:gene19604-25511_t